MLLLKALFTIVF